MPPALANGSHGLWAPWRTAVRGAQSPQQLVPQVLLLAHQLLPSALLAAAQGQPPQPAVGGGPFWQELLELLGMSAAAPHTLGATRGCGSSNYGGSSGPSPALAGGPLPTCLSVDEAVSLLAESIDWSQVRRLWLEDVAAANLAAASTAGPAGRFNGGAGAAPRPVGGRAIVTGSAAGQPPLLRAATSGTNLDAMATAAKAQGDLSAAEPGARPDESAAAAAAATSAPAATRTRPAAADAGTDDGGAAGTGLPCRQPTPGPVQLLTSCPADAAVPTGAPTAAAGTGDAGKPPRAPKKSLGPLPTPAQTPPKTALTVSPPVVALELNGGGEPPPPLGAEVAAPGVEAPAALL